jgi:tyrosine-specific transport protein
MKDFKVLGGILIILGTSIGAGMLALPISTYNENYIMTLGLLVASWLSMTFGALAILEVNLWLPEDSNLVSMAKATLGRSGQLAAWFTCLFLLYSLLCAYISGVGDILHSLLLAINIPIPEAFAAILPVIILGAIVYRGIYSVDLVNRGLMSVKMLTLLILIAAIMPHVETHNLFVGGYGLHTSILMVMITSFGYALIIPSLRTYFKSDVKKLRTIIIIGSCIPLVVYALWVTVIQGIIPRYGSDGLEAIANSSHATSLLITITCNNIHSLWLEKIVNVFISICAVTSFLGVAICLADFIADGLGLKKAGKNNIIIYTLTFLPPLLIVILAPGIFIKALSYAGMFCVILLMLLPLLMLYSGRYIKNIAHGYKIYGGKTIVICGLFISIILLIAIPFT